MFEVMTEIYQEYTKIEDSGYIEEFSMKILFLLSYFIYLFI
jgi:hypothetical protein